MTMTQNDTFSFRTVLIVHAKESYTQKSKFAYSTHTQQLTALFLAIFDLLCLTSHSTNEQTAEICCIFAPSTNESAQGASQEASITTKGGHNRRQAPVIY